VADDAVRLPIDFGNSAAEAKTVQTRINELHDAVRGLGDAFTKREIDVEQYRDGMRRLRTEIHELTKSLDTVDDATTHATHGRGGRGGTGMQGFGMAMLQASRGIQDFQAAGIMGMVNNVEGLAMALGLGAGLSGVATLAFVALQVLRPMFVGTGEDAIDATDEIANLTAEIEKLEKKPSKVRIDRTEIEDAKRELEALKAAKTAFDAEQKKQDTIESEIGKAVGSLIVETPGGQEAIAAAREQFATRYAENDKSVLALQSRILGMQVGQSQAAKERVAAREARQQFDTVGNRERERKAIEMFEGLDREIRQLQSQMPETTEVALAHGRNAFNVRREQAISGQGEEQQRGMAFLTGELNRSGGGALSKLILGAADAVSIKRENADLMAQGAPNEAAALAQLRAAKEERQQLDQEAEEAAAEAERTGKLATAARIRREREQEKAATDRRRKVEDLAGEVGPPLLPEIAGMLNQTGGRTSPASRAAMERAIAGRIAGAPGVGQENALAVAAEVLKRSIEAYQQRMWEQQQQMLQIMQMMNNQFGGMAGNQWVGQRMRGMAPTNLWRRP
jgi:hypothetical protein